MEFPILEIIRAKEEPEHIPVLLEQFPCDLAPLVLNREKFFHEFLSRLPSATEMRGIDKRLKEIAAQHNATLENLRWWDVSNYYLFGELIREKRQLRIGLTWKTTLKGSHPLLISSSCCWAPDRDSPGGHFLLIEAPSYQEVKANFSDWLVKPLALPPNFRF